MAWTLLGSSDSKPTDWRYNGEQVRRVLNWFRRHGYDVPVVVPSEDASEYYRVLWRAGDDRGIAVSDTDPVTMLEMCLEARDELTLGLLADEQPPYKALVGVAMVHDLPMDDEDRGILGEMTYKTARQIYTEMETGDVRGKE